MSYEFILALDPSGAFKEGNGTTGWCIMNTTDDVISKIGDIKAIKYGQAEAYWHRHLDLIDHFYKKYKQRFCVVMEDYLLYSNKALEQSNSRMETCKVIGIIQHYCWLKNIPYFMQTAAEVKPRWTDSILHYKKYIVRQGKDFALPATNEHIHRHSMDAIRHAVHFKTFKNK